LTGDVSVALLPSEAKKRQKAGSLVKSLVTDLYGARPHFGSAPSLA